MWIWKQQDGVMIRPDGSILAHGYSGAGEGRNNPAMQSVHDVGPIPTGSYTIEPTYTQTYEGKMPPVLPLKPDQSNAMFGRGGFLIHGDSIHAPGTASHGCVILPHSARAEISVSKDRVLKVV